TDEEFWRSLLRGLPEKVEAPVAVRTEDDLLAVRCPGPGKVLPFVQGQKAERFQSSSVGFKSGDIHILLPALLYVGQPLSVSRAAEILDLPRTDCKALGCVERPSGAGIDFH